MSNNASFYQASNSSTSTLRPRNNRLISYEGDTLQASPVASASGAGTPLRLGSRSASPSAAGNQARSKAKTQTVHLPDSGTHKRNVSDAASADRRASSAIWEPWSSISGITSSFLGGASGGNGSVKRASSTNTKKSSTRMLQDRSYNPKQAQPEWGPKTETDPKPTSIEEHKALLQAKKREALLLQGIAVEAGRDSLGRYKRKDSNASIRSPVDPAHLEDDVLVYRHKVQPQDTMAGVVIKYSCQPEAFRKINRFWPNDNIQRKDWVVLPVDACAARGRKTEGPYMEGLYDERESGQKGKQPFTGDANGTDTTSIEPTEPFPPAYTGMPKEDGEYRHDSWVLLPSFSQPVEIVRISKRALGYFPPARRKSPSISASSTPFNDSATSTPKTSFDMLRHPPSHAAQQAQLNQQLQASLSLNTSPVRQASIPHLMTSSRTRSSSTVSAPNGTSQNAFLSALSGPGGVGTLRGLRTERARPGPAEDALNKKFAQYFPDQLPPDHPDYQNPNKLRPPRPRATSNSLRATPRASVDSIRSTRSNSSSVPAAIAGWMGKVASSPMRKKNDLRLERSDLSLIGEDGAAAGDLIELSDTPDEVSKQLHDAVEEEADRTPPAVPLGAPRIAQERAGKNAKAVNEEDLLNERFPVRGRVRRAYEND